MGILSSKDYCKRNALLHDTQATGQILAHFHSSYSMLENLGSTKKATIYLTCDPKSMTHTLVSKSFKLGTEINTKGIFFFSHAGSELWPSAHASKYSTIELCPQPGRVISGFQTELVA